MPEESKVDFKKFKKPEVPVVKEGEKEEEEKEMIIELRYSPSGLSSKITKGTPVWGHFELLNRGFYRLFKQALLERSKENTHG